MPSMVEGALLPQKVKAAACATALPKLEMQEPYFFLAGAAVVFCRPAVASTFGFSFLGFLASLFERS